MRHAAPVSLALLPLLLLGTAGCQSAPAPAAGSPVAAPREYRDDARDAGADGAGASPAAAVKGARIGEVVTISGREVGRHLRAVLDAYVDPAIGLTRNQAPAKGKRWVGAGMSFANVGGSSYGELGRVWALDRDGGRHEAVPTGELTTGKPLPAGSLGVGDEAEGWVVFEIPENVHIVQLQYRDANTQANSGEGFWQV
ncbi:hypothetical protein [Streptomyces sp. NPDC089919]|uniref:hypothetical protein n=1 Tax=Streptomyces sp. NPDC089919 TaxID=3155188 RepID=UPI003437E190